MESFHAVDGGASTSFEPVEAALLTQLASQVAGILGVAFEPPEHPHPALERLLPDAYRGDDAASAEFRRFTSTELAERKVQNAQAIIADVAEALVADDAVEVTLTADSVQAWVRSLTDIRLVLATRLGIEADGDSGWDDDEAFMLADVYAWLGWVQESLVDVLDA